MKIDLTEGERRKILAFANKEMHKLRIKCGTAKSFERAQILIDKLKDCRK